MYRNTNALANEELARVAPSIFAGVASSRVSSKYSFFPTISVVETLKKEGWNPVRAQQSRTRKAEREGFQKHIVRFRRADLMSTQVGESFPELVLINSHDGGCAYQLHAGVYRLVCSNGMVVSDGLFQRLSVKHSGFKSDDVIEASYRVLESLPKVMSSVEEMKSIQLRREEAQAFAESALMVKYGQGAETVPVSSDQILVPRRYEDRGANLWQTLNVVQENLIRGGLSGWSGEGRKRRRITTRAVNSIDTDTDLNKALWSLAEKMKALKAS